MGLFDFFKDAGEAIADAVGLGDDDAPASIKEKIAGYDLNIDDLTVGVEGDKVVLGGTANDAQIAEKAILTAGNIKGVSQVESNITVKEDAPEPVFYTVKSGDTLSKISKDAYGDANRYNEIFEANKPMLSSPDKIYPGQNLRIPGANSAQVAA